MASQASQSSGTAAYLCPSSSEIDAAPTPFYGHHLAQNLLFLYGIFAAADGFAAGEKYPRLAVPLPNPSDVMGDQASLRAIKSYVSHFDLRYRFNRDRFAAADSRKHAPAIGSETHPAAAAQ